MMKTGNKNINTQEYWDSRYIDRSAYEKETGMARFNHALYEIENGNTVLDIGCGIGTFCELVKSKYPECSVYGTDISKQTIIDNRRRHKGIQYYNLSVGKQDKLQSNFFDVVFSGEVLEHLDNPSQLFQDAFRVLKSGGTFIVTTPNEMNIQTPEHVWYFTRDDVDLLFEINGFTDTKQIYLPNGEDQLVIIATGMKP